eukprot:SAG31_NODE_42214_length_272_cov_1.179191_1_plen_48_part_01
MLGQLVQSIREYETCLDQYCTPYLNWLPSRLPFPTPSPTDGPVPNQCR